jgi:hypothetical protein
VLKDLCLVWAVENVEVEAAACVEIFPVEILAGPFGAKCLAFSFVRVNPFVMAQRLGAPRMAQKWLQPTGGFVQRRVRATAVG